MHWKNVNELLTHQAKTFGNKTYLVDIEKNKSYTYKEFHEKLNQTANILYIIGIRKGDRVGVVLPNCTEICLLFFGCMKIGAVFNPVSTLLKEEEIMYNFNLSQVKIIIADEESYSKVKNIASSLKSLKRIFTVAEFNTLLSEQSATFSETETVIVKDYATFVYTSGTTAHPKGIRITQKNIFANQYASISRWELTNNDRHLCTVPLAWAAGQYNFLFSSMLTGATLMLPLKFSKHNFWQWIKKYKITYTFLVPTMAAMLLNPPEKISKKDIASLRLLTSAGASLPIEVLKQFEEIFGVPIYEQYGLSEITSLSNVTFPHLHLRKPGSVGQPLSCCEVKIFDDVHNEVRRGEVGEICIRGENVFDGYVDNTEANKTAFEGGWFHSGDLGYLDADGYLYIVGRKKEIIIRGGINISPAEVDAVLYNHFAVKECAAFGLPDKIYGEEIYAAVVLKDNIKVTESELQSHCRQHLADFKCPQKIFFVTELPKGPTGKLQRRKLAEQFLAP